VSATRDSDAERVAALEREQAERIAQAHAAAAAAQDKTYWLDRWGVDLNALMQRPGASELRAAVRAAREVKRRAVRIKRAVDRRREEARSARRAEAVAPPEHRRSVFQRTISPDSLRASPVTDLLYERVDDADVAAVAALAEEHHPHELDVPDAAERHRKTIHLGVHHGVPGVLEATGLTQATPPEGVHSMSRGPGAAGGSLYYADMVADGLAQAGIGLAAGGSVLDFGCSSGRVVRVLAAAYPGCEWYGCDPIPEAIAWAREHIPEVEFLDGPGRPPLPFDDGQLDAAFAISIWSHFAEPAAKAWLAEMHRIIRPGGVLWLSTHGLQSVVHDRGRRLRSEEQLTEISAALNKAGFWYAPEFGEKGDFGVIDPEWGTAFLTPEWLLAAVTPQWRVAAFAPGRLEDNQDLYVLHRP